MRGLPVLKDVSVDSQLKSDQPIVGGDDQKATAPGVKDLPTMTISFSLAPKVALADAMARIHDLEIRLALPATITTSLARAN